MAKYYAMCSLEHFGFHMNTNLLCDSVAARGIAQRSGLGKMKALAIRALQENVENRGLQIKPVT